MRAAPAWSRLFAPRLTSGVEWHPRVQYPEFLRTNAGQLSAEDERRYRRQYEITAQLVRLYDESPTPDPKRLMELMTEVRRAAPVPVSVQRPFPFSVPRPFPFTLPRPFP